MRVEINGQDLRMDCKEVMTARGQHGVAQGVAKQDEVGP